MGLASIFSRQASLASLIDTVGLQPAQVEQIITIAWQWLVFAAVIAWIGVLIAGYRLLSAFRGQQSSEITAVLHVAAQRQRRQGWLWLSMMLAGMLALFWLRLSHVLPHQQLNRAPDWSALGLFVFSTPEGWLWLARGGLVLLGGGLLTAFSLAARRRARREHFPDLLTRRERLRHQVEQTGSVQHRTGENSLRAGRVHQGTLSVTLLTAEIDSHRRQLLAEQRNGQMLLAVGLALLCTLLLPLPDTAPARLPITMLALNGVALLALAVWLGSALYLAAVLAPATRIIEGDERTQRLVEMVAAIRPALTQTCIAPGLYGLFLVEARLPGVNDLPVLLDTPFGWVMSAEVMLLGMMLLLSLYQSRGVFPALAQAAWLAARGTVMSVLGGMDVSRSLQITQRERQALAQRAERRLTRIAAAQVILGLLILLCLALAAFLGGPSAI
jgi:hypothetical protein